MDYTLVNQNQNQITPRIVTFLTIIAFFSLIPLFEPRAANWNNSSSAAETTLSDKTLNISEVIQSFDVIIKAETLQSLKRLPWEYDFSRKDIVDQGFDPAIVSRVINMVLRSEYKRRQAPPGVKVSKRSFGRDRRYPITSGALNYLKD